MKFKPGDIAWVCYWNCSTHDSWSDWCLVVENGVEQVVTVIEYVGWEGYREARVMGADNEIFVIPDDYLVDEKTAKLMRAKPLRTIE